MDHLINGFISSISWVNLLACFLGAFIGTMVGVLPGLGPTATMALMLPFTFVISPTSGLIMLTGVWFGAMYGGSTTSILVNIPGEAASVVTCIEGYQMARKGRAGAALALVGIGSFVAGTIGIIGLQIFAPILGAVALSFGPPEYLSFMILAFIFLSTLASESPLKGFLMLGLGIWLSSIGLDLLTSVPRFTFGFNGLMLGIDFLPIAMGLFGIAEILDIALKPYAAPTVHKPRFRDLYPNRNETKRSVLPVFRGSILGFFVGLLPGPAAVLSTFLAYALEKRISKTPEKFGTGMVEGVVSPEAANNSAVMGGLIPLLTLGIPFAAPSAILLAGMRMHNIEPGPLLFQQRPDMFWTFIAAMYLGNMMLLVLNLPLVGMFARIAMIRPEVLMPYIGVICLVGIYSVRNSLFDAWVMIFAGIVGFFLRKWKYPIALLIIGMVLGPTAEYNLRQTLMLFKGNLVLIFERPTAFAFLAVAALFIGIKILFHFLRIGRQYSIPKEQETDI